MALNKKKYTLTISILASNRKDTLPKTLASIKPLLDNVSSELILVDTGCDEELLSIIGQYTDKIIRFQWCRDFAKARNAGLELAQGEWFLFIDDDEWFEDVSELVEFFNSEEKDRYGYARYFQRNYHNMEGTSWADFAAGRVFKLNEGTRFVDKIHERPINIDGPVKQFGSYAHHYGYVYKSQEEKKAHIERNLTLLKEQVKEEPSVARHYGHIIQEYCATKEYESIIETAKSGIKNADMTTDDNKKDVPGLYASIGWALLNMGQYEEVLKEAKVYLASEYCNKLCEATWLAFCATASCNLKASEECVAYVDKYLALRDYLLAHESERFSMSAVIVVYALEDDNVRRVATAGMTSALQIGNMNVFKRCMGYVDAGAWIKEKPLAWWIEALDRWSGNVKIRELIEMKQAMEEITDRDSLHISYFDMIFEEGLLIRRRLEDMSLKELRDEISVYAGRVIAFYRNIYVEECFESYETMLPARCQAALLLMEMCQKGAEFDEIKRRNLVKLMPGFKRICLFYKDLIEYQEKI